MHSAKYPRTLHFPFSPGTTSDDRFINDEEFESFLNEELVFTEKLDGSNVCLTSDAFYSRSHGGEPRHPSFNLLRTIHRNFLRNEIEEGISVFGEWCYAVHSIQYSVLQDYLNIFGVRNDATGEWWDWDDVILMANALGFPTVPVLLRGTVSNKSDLKEIIEELSSLSSVYGPTREGLVVRKISGVIEQKDERGTTLVGLAKWVREDHVQTDRHWTKKAVEIQPTLSALKVYQ